MRTTTLALIATIVSTVVCATIPGLPACAGNCVTSFGNCQQLDVKCICSDSTLLSDLACCVSKNCDAADQNATITFADSLCEGQGVSDLPTAATCAATATASSVGNSSATSSVTGLTTTPASLSSALASASSAADSGSSSSSATQTSASGSMSSAAAVASSSGAAAAASAASATSEARANVVEGMGFGLVAAGILAVI